MMNLKFTTASLALTLLMGVSGEAAYLARDSSLDPDDDAEPGISVCFARAAAV